MAYIDLVPVERATGTLRRMYDAALQRAGRVYNIVRTMSPNPPALQASIAFYATIMRGPSGLSRRERELLATVTSRVNDCYYWTEAHAEDFRLEGGDDETARHIRDNYTEAKLTDRERAMCDYAKKLSRTPGAMREQDLEPLRAVGLSEPEIHDAVQVIAFFNYINRVADALGTDLEPEMAPRPEGWGGAR